MNRRKNKIITQIRNSGKDGTTSITRMLLLYIKTILQILMYNEQTVTNYIIQILDACECTVMTVTYFTKWNMRLFRYTRCKLSRLKWTSQISPIQVVILWANAWNFVQNKYKTYRETCPSNTRKLYWQHFKQHRWFHVDCGQTSPRPNTTLLHLDKCARNDSSLKTTLPSIQ